MFRAPGSMWTLWIGALLAVALSGCGDGKDPVDPATPAPAEVAVSPPTDTLTFGSEATLQVAVYDEEGEVLASAHPSWQSSAPAVVEVDQTGRIEARSVGTARITARVGDVEDWATISVVPRGLPLTALNPSVAAYEVLAIQLPAEAPSPGAGTLAGVIGADTLWFQESSPRRIEALVLGVATGPRTLRIDFDANQYGTVDLVIAPPPVVADPEAVVDDVAAHIDATLADVEAAAATDPELEGTDVLDALARQYHAWADTASAESKLQVAQFFAAYPGLLGSTASAPMLTAAAGIGRADASGDCLAGFSGDEPEEQLAGCEIAIGIGLQALVLGGLASTVACRSAFTSNLCLAGLGATAGGYLLARRSVKRARSLTGAIVDHRLDAFLEGDSNLVASLATTDALPGAGGLARVAGTSGAPESGLLEVTSGRSYRLGATATYRSVVAADASGSGVLAALVAHMAEFDVKWSDLQSSIASLPSFIRALVPDLPAALGPAPTQPAATSAADISSRYLSVVEPEDGIDILFDPQDRSFRLDVKQGLKAEFAFGLRYASPVDTFVQSVTGSARVDAKIEVVSGNDQSGVAGAALADPIVVRVTDTVTGKGIAGVTVTWTVAGGGDLSDTTTSTDEDGTASVSWTLGISATDAQSVEAAVSYDDGTPVGGSPAQFSVLRHPLIGTWDVSVSLSGNSSGSTSAGGTLTPRTFACAPAALFYQGQQRGDRMEFIRPDRSTTIGYQLSCPADPSGLAGVYVAGFSEEPRTFQSGSTFRLEHRGSFEVSGDLIVMTADDTRTWLTGLPQVDRMRTVVQGQMIGDRFEGTLTSTQETEIIFVQPGTGQTIVQNQTSEIRGSFVAVRR